MTVKTITVPDSDSYGRLHGTKNVTVEWNCPTCGKEMGNPKLENFCNDGVWYVVHKWDNKCGHIARYTDLKEV
ncbi:TPA: hypothetical protein ROY11_004493 [Bacillus cereus]|uniref:hypothetical protein n=1 Tax=Bacillus thuringiensis TaxID=1428 RepID=UPI0003ADB62A|nr:hypothetical protein [Bacillus thuringiensis]ETE97337.1 hypothetical protein C623_0215135 [Bacillus thuringiensis serovar aizawai str. Hu4-2]MEB8648336.1 hypothetical protein [Bacillus cereus]MEB8667944.1 hypothetical protein [Bacillus cereus]HDX9607355.1 hypothetical protein [Bacillus cereus]